MGISYGSFTWWRHRLRRSAGASIGARRPASTSPKFVRVDVLPAGEPRPDRDVARTGTGRVSGSGAVVPLEIVLPGKIRVRIGRDCDPAFLGRVLTVLRVAAC